MRTSKDLLQQIWQSADLLRGPLTADAARDAFANLLFYRWVDEEADRNPVFRDAVFAMQATRYRWRAALNLHPHDLGVFLHEEVYPYLGSLDRSAPDVAFFFRLDWLGPPTSEIGRLAAIVDRLNVHALSPDEASALVDGLLPFDEGRPAIRTPEPIRELFAEVLQVEPNEGVLDLACGTGGFLHDIALKLAKQEHDLTRGLGIDVQPSALKFARLRFLLSRMPVPEFRLGDALSPDELPDGELGRFGVVVCDPPLARGLRWGALRAFDTPTPQSELLFLQLAMRALGPDGRAAFVVPAGFFFQGGAAREVRETLFQKFTPEGIFALPRGSIPGTTIETLVVFFRRRDQHASNPKRLFFVASTGSESVQDFVPRALHAWRGRFETSRAGRWLELEELSRSNYNVLRFKETSEIAARPHRPALEVTLQELQNRWNTIGGRLKGLEGLSRTRFPCVPLGDVIHRVRAGPIEGPDVWLLTLDQIEARTGRVLEKRRGDPSHGKSSGMVPFDSGDILFSRLNPHLAKAIVADEPGYCVSDLIPFRAESSRVQPSFVASMMRRQIFVERARAAAVGTGRIRISVDELLRIPIPVPPFVAQSAIVAALESAAVAAREADAIATVMHSLSDSVADRLLGDDLIDFGET